MRRKEAVSGWRLAVSRTLALRRPSLPFLRQGWSLPSVTLAPANRAASYQPLTANR